MQSQALLHLLLKISDSVTRLESLLLIVTPDKDVSGSPEVHGSRMPAHLNHTEEAADDRFVLHCPTYLLLSEPITDLEGIAPSTLVV